MEKNYNHFKITLEEIDDTSSKSKTPVSVEVENKDSIVTVIKKLLGKDKNQCDIQDLSQFAWP